MSCWAIYCWAICVGRKQKSPVQHSKAICVCAQQNSPNKNSPNKKLFIYIYIYIHIYIYILLFCLFFYMSFFQSMSQKVGLLDNNNPTQNTFLL